MGGRRTRSRTIITRVIVLLLLGAIVNVAVAWGFTLVGLYDWDIRGNRGLMSWFSELSSRHDLQFRNRWSGWGGAISPGSKQVWVTGDSAHEVSNIGTASAIQAGWPRLCVEGEELIRTNLSDQTSRRWSRGALDLKTTAPTVSFLPLLPLWPGFAINTVFYAGILWLLFAGPFALRRRIRGGRIKRGLCPKCAYPVGTWGGDVCTECGQQLRSSQS